MLRKLTVLSLVLVFILALAATAYAAPGQPNFGPAIFADGEVYGTKGTTNLPAPNGHNNQSFDKLFVVTNGAPGQLPVSEAGPGNPNYNGGRWSAQEVTWVGGEITLLTSYEQIMYHHQMGDLQIVDLERYFQCPLLPTK